MEENRINPRASMAGKQVDSRFAIFKDFKYLKILLIVATLEFSTNAFYYGVQFSLG